MNKLIVAIGLIVYASFSAHGQGGTGVGTFDFHNIGVPQEERITDDLTGQPVSGNNYQIAVFYGAPGTTDESLMTQVGAPVGFLLDGQFSGGVRTIFDLSENGAVVAFQARAWDASTGDTTWAQAVANPAGRIGKGPIFNMKTKDPFDITEPFPPVLGFDPGWQGFAIAVPEPSTWALAAMGVAGLLLWRWRRG